MATAANDLIRVKAYIFLALIIVSYRSTYDEAHLRATYDGLTGVLNTSSFHAAAAKKFAAARRLGQTLIAVRVELNGFQDVPAVHGPSAADSALRAFARRAMDSIRGSDLVGRLGWHQFGFVVHVPSEYRAEPLARLLHERLTGALNKTGLPLSCTMGALVISPRSAPSDVQAFDAAHRLVRAANERGETVEIMDHMPT
jgi:diguanylate cyclase (GGDEF)-like protein